MAAKSDAAPTGDSNEPKKDDRSFIQLDGNKKGAAPAVPAARSRVVAGVLAAACVALIVVSLGFVYAPANGSWSLAWVASSLSGSSVSGAATRSKTVASGGTDPASGTTDGSRGETGDSKEKDSEAEKDGKGSKEDKASSNKKKNGSSDSVENSGDTSSQSGNGANSVVGAGSNATSGNGGGNSNGGSTGNGSSTSNGGSANGGSQDDGLVTVKVSVTSSAVSNPVSASGTYSFREGATVYDALCALGLSVNAHGSQYGTYVAAIGGLAEKEHGGTSGWMYSVNGSMPMTACSNYVLSNGDSVVWYYVTG